MIFNALTPFSGLLGKGAVKRSEPLAWRPCSVLATKGLATGAMFACCNHVASQDIESLSWSEEAKMEP